MSNIENNTASGKESGLLEKARYVAIGSLAASAAHVTWDAIHWSPDFFGVTTGLASYGCIKLMEQLEI